jgi:hypothetical protein
MATNLEFIKSATGTSVSSLSVTDCFSAKYDVYKVVGTDFNPSTEFNLELRYIDSGGSTISTSTYDRAFLNMLSYSAFVESRNVNTTSMIAVGTNQTNGNGFNFEIYNPFSSSSYTFNTHQASTDDTSGGRGYKGINVEKSTTSVTGLYFFVASGTFSINNISVYGVK